MHPVRPSCSSVAGEQRGSPRGRSRGPGRRKRELEAAAALVLVRDLDLLDGLDQLQARREPRTVGPMSSVRWTPSRVMARAAGRQRGGRGWRPARRGPWRRWRRATRQNCSGSPSVRRRSGRAGRPAARTSPDRARASAPGGRNAAAHVGDARPSAACGWRSQGGVAAVGIEHRAQEQLGVAAQDAGEAPVDRAVGHRLLGDLVGEEQRVAGVASGRSAYVRTRRPSETCARIGFSAGRAPPR